MSRDAADVQHELDRLRRGIEQELRELRKTTDLEVHALKRLLDEALERVTTLERRLARQCDDCGRVPQDPTEDHGCGQ